MAQDDASWCAALSEIIDSSHLVTAYELLDVLDSACARVDLTVELLLADLTERTLRPIGAESSEGMDGTLAGRAFRFSEIVAHPQGDEPGAAATLYVPVVDGTDRVGVLRIGLPDGADPGDPALRRRCWTLAGLIGHLVVAKRPYSDVLHQVRRTQPLSVASELLSQLLPPRTFASRDLVVSAVMEPFDQVGGDGYDYAVDDRHAYLAVFDSIGHDLHAGLITTAVLAATRNARRGGADLAQIAAAADAVLREAPLTGAFSTAVLADVDLTTGTMRYLLAGHPPPVLLRDSRAVQIELAAPRPPLGVWGSGDATGLGSVALQPRDRILLHTDGVTEARDPDGAFFGLDRLVDLTERHEAAGLSPPETLRRIVHAVLEHQNGILQDDATLMLLEWSTAAATTLLPNLD